MRLQNVLFVLSNFKRTYIFNGKRDTMYVGVSKNPRMRWNNHNYMARKGKNTPLYNCMREHEFFLITVKCFRIKLMLILLNKEL